MTVEPTRGERNNNPGNLDFVAVDPWEGQVGLELVPEGENFTPRFGRYSSPELGLRALGRQLLAYQERHGCNTPRLIANRWAPPVENNTTAYAKDLAASLGVDLDTAVDLHDAATLAVAMRTIIRHENGRCIYDADLIASAGSLALAA